MLIGPGGIIETVGKDIVRFFRHFNFRGKVVLIVGGSRGLGLEIARKLKKEKVKVVLAARDADELEQARHILNTEGNVVNIQVCDITDKAAVEKMVEDIQLKLGSVDVLINCAGEIEVGPIDTMSFYDFQSAMNTHFWGPLYTMLSVIPEMRKKRSGRIVNISSIGGKLAVPHMVPYCASKHAAAGLSEGMRVELLRDNIYVTTVYPGMMRTGSHLNAKFKGDHQIEYAWFSILNALPFTSVSSEDAAQAIIEACRSGKPDLVISLPAQIMTKMQGLFPNVVSEALGFGNFFLPAKRDNGRYDSITRSKRGRESRSELAPPVVTMLSDAAAVHNNE